MNFINRLKYYSVGITLGIFISFFFFKDRNCNGWLPKNRVKDAMLTYPFYSSNYQDCMMDKQHYTRDSLAEFIANASIDFSKSNTTSNPRIYNLVYRQKSIKIAVNYLDSIIYVNEFTGVIDTSCTTLSKKNFRIANQLKGKEKK